MKHAMMPYAVITGIAIYTTIYTVVSVAYNLIIKLF